MGPGGRIGPVGATGPRGSAGARWSGQGIHDRSLASDHRHLESPDDPETPAGSYVVNATVHVGDVHTRSAGICRLNQDDTPIVEYLSTINTVIPFVKAVSSADDTKLSVTCRAYQPTELPFVGYMTATTVNKIVTQTSS